MTHNEIVTMLEETGLPVAYDHFAEGESPDPPFFLFLLPRTNNFFADGEVYEEINRLHVELYTDLKDPVTEKKVENVLGRHGFTWNKSEVWIAEERLYEVLYEMEVQYE